MEFHPPLQKPRHQRKTLVRWTDSSFVKVVGEKGSVANKTRIAFWKRVAECEVSVQNTKSKKKLISEARRFFTKKNPGVTTRHALCVVQSAPHLETERICSYTQYGVPNTHHRVIPHLASK